MSFQNLIYKEFQGLLSQQKIVSIIGESGTGKTTLALQLVSNLMTNKDSKINEQTIWVQASESFPKNRLLRIYQDNPELASNLLKNIFIIPKQKPFSNITSQSRFLRNFKNLILPPFVKYIVIDNISHHLRFAQANITLFQKKMKLMNDFFNNQLYPLIMFSLHNNYQIFLIHEVSFDPKLGQLRAYNSQLFDRIKSVKIQLSKSIGTQLKSMKISAANFYQLFTYEITDQGLLIL